MGWPKGVPRKKKEAQPETPGPYVAPVIELDRAIPSKEGKNEGVVVSDKNSIEELSISVYPTLEPSLTSKESDPFTKFKVNEEKWAYRAINKRPQIISQRESQGWQVVPGSPELGDLVLARTPREAVNRMKKSQHEKTTAQTNATKERFKDEAARSGVKTFEEN